MPMADSPPIFKRIAVLGVGLMGGSLAIAAKRMGAVESVIGWGRSEMNLSRAQELGYIDSWTTDLQKAIAGVDCVVIATPTQFAEQLMVDVVKSVADTTVVTDVASVKANLVVALKSEFGNVPSNVVLGHPIAGSEKGGVDAVDPELYLRHKVILIEGAVEQQMKSLTALWEAVGAEVSLMSAEQHDAVLAMTSHLPHMLSYALVGQIAQSDLEEDVFAYAAGGLRDFSRVAGSDPVMWSEILLANHEQVLKGLQGFDDQIQKLKQALLRNDSKALIEMFADAREHRNRFADAYEVRTQRGDVVS